MSGLPFPDVLGPLVLQANADAAVNLRQRVRVFGGLTLDDEPEAARALLIAAPHGYRVTTAPARSIEFSAQLPVVPGLSAADLVRVDSSGEGTYAINGLVDASRPLLAPWKAIKYLANVGVNDVFLDAPAELAEGNHGPFLNSRLLESGRTLRVVWDAVSYGYRICGGSAYHYLTLDGDYVTIDGERIVF